MSSLRQNSNMLNDQKIEPNEHYEEVGHVTDSIDHEYVQAYGQYVHWGCCPLSRLLPRPPLESHRERD